MRTELRDPGDTRRSKAPGIGTLSGPAAHRAHPTMVEALEAAAAADAPLFTLHIGKEPERVDARAALAGAHRVARALRRAGVAPGDAVPILLPTSAELVHGLLGVMLAGAAPAPLATPMTFGALDRFVSNLAAVVEDSGARVILTYGRVRDAIAGDARLSARLRTVLTAEDLDGAGPTLDPRSASIDATTCALLQYTSGTTGQPKGVVISHGALTANAGAIATGLGLCPADVGVAWLPLYHDMGLVGVLCTAVCHPYPIHAMRPESFIMQPRRWLGLLAREGGTISVAPNFAYDLAVRRIKEDPEGSLAAWRVALNGAEPVHETTIRRFADRFAAAGYREETMTPVYGMAEATLAVTFSDPASAPRTLRLDRDSLARGSRVRSSEGADAYVAVSVGQPVAGASVRVADETGRVLGERQVGEILVGGASLMDGYRDRPDATAEALRDGLLRSGDLGFVDGGELFVVGRAKEVIIMGGRNVYPYDVERVAAELVGASAGAAAFGRSNDETGTDDLVVVVEAREPDEDKRAQLVKTIRGELLAVLGVQASQIELWPIGTIPRTTSGKVRRAACAQALDEGRSP